MWRARRQGSPQNESRHGAGKPTNVRRRGLALFERELRASPSASSLGAGEGRRPVDRRDETLFEGELFRRGSGIGRMTGGLQTR